MFDVDIKDKLGIGKPPDWQMEKIALGKMIVDSNNKVILLLEQISKQLKVIENAIIENNRKE